jgi:hypothetical protein
MLRKISLLILLSFSALILGTVLLSCSSGTPVVAPQTNTSSTEPFREPSPKTPFERDLQFIRNGQFTYVWVFSRADGKPLDKDDADFLRKSAPQVVDWVTTDDRKRAIGGTNFDLEQGGLPALRKRFIVEDYTGK